MWQFLSWLAGALRISQREVTASEVLSVLSEEWMTIPQISRSIATNRGETVPHGGYNLMGPLFQLESEGLAVGVLLSEVEPHELIRGVLPNTRNSRWRRVKLEGGSPARLTVPVAHH